MHYQVSRNGQMYGPYTLEDLQRYLASGNVLPTDLVKNEEMPEWVPVSQLLSAQLAAAAGAVLSAFSTPPSYADAVQTVPVPVVAASASAYPDAPNLHWGLVILFAFLSCGLFMPIWNLVVSAWLKKVQPNAAALFFYLGALVLLFVNWMVGAASSVQMMSSHEYSRFGPHIAARGSLLGVIWVIRLIARYSERGSLQEHFNTVEPIGLVLNPIMTFFFGGVYFQYHLNRINLMKQAARYGSGQTF